MTANRKPVDRAAVKRVFERALAVPEAEREEFVRRTCADDPELAAEVATLLAHHHGDTVLAPPPGDDAPRSVKKSAPARDPDATRRQRRSFALAAVAGCAIVGIGLALLALVRSETRGLARARLETALESSDVAVSLLLDSLEEHAAAAARDPVLRAALARIVAAPSDEALAADMSRVLDGWLRRPHLGVSIVDDSGKFVAVSTALREARLGRRLNAEGLALIARAREARRPVVKMPYAAGLLLADETGALGQPVFSVIVPVFGEEGDFLATLAFAVDPETTLSPLLAAERSGATGEAYAFDPRGVLLTTSRFETELRRAGLLVGDDAPRSALRIRLCDPGRDLREQSASVSIPTDRPLTRLVSAAISGGSGVDLDGYPGYLGNEVIGAWRWNAVRDYGIAVEMGAEEAYRALAELERGGIALLALLALATAWAVRSAHIESRLGAELSQAAEFGSYKLERRLGVGGMGEVWLARHALLSRPVALKLIKRGAFGIDLAAAEAAFRREVELTSRLTHPNIITVHDFGVAASGDLFYVMEYVDGIDLKRLVRDQGPLEPRRVAHIVREVCAALAEAHGAGLIHRDIKASNVMLCRRGGVDDCVELLDFGLVIERTQGFGEATRSGFAVGTPAYIPPERWLDPGSRDPRGDLFAVGVLAYFLLTGRLPFGGESGETSGGYQELARRIREEIPQPLAIAAPSPPPEYLTQLVTALLEKDPALRPQSASDVVARLAARSD